MVVCQWAILGDSTGFLEEKLKSCSCSATARFGEKQGMSWLFVNLKAKNSVL